MPVTIERDPITELVQFHREIRSMLKQIAGLKQMSQAECDEVLPSVASLLGEAIVWHDIDEEVSVFTRLRHLGISKRVDAVLKDCSLAHEALEKKIAEFLKTLNDKTSDVDALTKGGRELAQILEPHLAMEEQELFPLARLVFDEDDLQQIRAEMDQRSKQRASGKKSVVAIN